MGKTHSLAANHRYQKFVRDRNQALEDLHIKAQMKMSAVIHEMLLAAKDIARSRYGLVKSYGIYSAPGRNEMARFEVDLRRIFQLGTPQLIQIMKQLRKQVYLLAFTGESEALGQALGHQTKYNVTAPKLMQKQREDTYTGGAIEDRVQLTINKLIRRIINQVEISAVNEDNESDFYDKLKSILPKPRKVSVNQRNVSVGPKLKESEIGPKQDMSVGFVDDETWDEMVDVYMQDQVPSWRGPDQSFEIKNQKGDATTVYAWELEQEVTQDFVYQVRLGQVDAAKENGITEYVWVAIVDSRTDDCCLWRDGLTTGEIEKRLKTDRKDDNCQAIVPPAHFNCRCVLAPVVEETPEVPEDNIKDFEEWLTT